ncbi:unnamed protein product [Psylliodes chrysocephalus]|uniref:Glucose-methanol-choline oxidoreductase N-terminal domain-containing protein n=1 Tax=Psylliodes chrysocephalus TaxID=3402493 RepID=A0A9P0CWJ9_9CUCU|nr:unnamed protein product [Psylliodes chrysocephala]
MSTLSLNNTCPGNLQGTSAGLFLTLINTLMTAKCSLGNSKNYPEDFGPNIRDGDGFDFIVIGGGSAGAVVANKLSENRDWRVLVLEAGGLPSATSDIPALTFNLQGTQEDWAYKTQPQKNSCLSMKNKQCKWPRGKVLGGTSVLNAMLYVKGNKGNYDHWAELGNTGWDWKSIKKYFTKLEQVLPPESENTPLGTKGLLTLTKISSDEPIKISLQKAYEQLGIKYLKEQNPEKPIGTVDVPMCIEKGQRANTGKKILGNYRSRHNLLISLRSFVRRIIIEEKVARGVEVEIGGKLLKLKAKKEVIVSGGAINSPQLLMLSGIGPKKHLQNLGIHVVQDLPVGRFLQDHLISWQEIKLSLDAIKYPKGPADPLYEYFMRQEGPLASISLTNFVSFLNTKNDSMWPNLGFHYFLFPPNDQLLSTAVSRGVGFVDSIVSTRSNECKLNPCLMMIPTLLTPKSMGRIMLKSKNPRDYPLIYSGYLTDEADEDMTVMIEAIRFNERLIQTAALRKHNPEVIRYPIPECDKLEYGSDAYWECFMRHVATTLYHPTSTCRMGVRKNDSVVDPRLRVHGIKKLRVADASIMPKVISGNTHAPSMMIGFKASDMIKEDWLE